MPRWPWARVAVVLVLLVVVGLLSLLPGACGGGEQAGTGAAQPGAAVVATTSYLADIVRNVAGGRVSVVSLMPDGADPHSFEPRPRDIRTIAESRLVITDIRGAAPLVDSLVDSALPKGSTLIEAAAGLPARKGEDAGHGEAGGQIDPHFWLDPVNVIGYVSTIRDGLSRMDPDGAAIYRSNASIYVAKLESLDAWIRGEVAGIPPERRLLVTNHETFGYFADRYGFTVVGTVFKTLGAEGTPSAKQLADLIDKVRILGVPAIFLEKGSNSDLADEVGRETRVKVITDLYTHSLGPQAPDYISMIEWDVERIVEALR